MRQMNPPRSPIAVAVIFAGCLTIAAWHPSPAHGVGLVDIVEQELIVNPVLISVSSPADSVSGSISLKVTVSSLLLSTRRTSSSLYLTASCVGRDDFLPISIDGSAQATPLPTAANAQPSYNVTLEWDGWIQGELMPAQAYDCDVVATVRRGSDSTNKETSSAPHSSDWVLEYHSDVDSVDVEPKDAENPSVYRVQNSSTITADVSGDPDDSDSRQVTLSIPEGAELSTSASLTQTGELIVTLDVLPPEDVPQGPEPLLGVGQVVRISPLETQVLTGAVKLLLPYDAIQVDPSALVPARFDQTTKEWILCDEDPLCGGFSVDSKAGVLIVETNEFSEWTTVNSNGLTWRVSFLSTVGTPEILIRSDQSNTIAAFLSVKQLESSYDEVGEPVTDQLDEPYVRWVESTPEYPASPDDSKGTLGEIGTYCAEYPTNCPYQLTDVIRPAGTYHLQAVLTFGPDVYVLGSSSWSDTLCPGVEPTGVAMLAMYQCLTVVSGAFCFPDADGDSYGDPSNPIDASSAPTNCVPDARDCDDTRADVHPDQEEICNDLADTNCSPEDDTACWKQGTFPMSSEASARFVGEAAGDLAGTSIVSGDFDGDGDADVAIGAPAAAGGRGRVYISYGPIPPGVHALSNAALVLEGEGSFDQAGFSLNTLPDTDGDGSDELLVGAPSASPDGQQKGAVYLVLGLSGGLSGTYRLDSADARFDGQNSWGFFGYSLATVGDLDGNGAEDLLIGAPEDGVQDLERPGAAHVLYGPFTSGQPMARVALAGPTPGGLFGYSVAGGTDLNGDSRPDLLIGAPGLSGNGNSRGAFFVVAGASASALASWPSTLSLAQWWGESDQDRVGYAGTLVSSYGAVDSTHPEGTPALVLGAELHDNISGQQDAGAFYLATALPGSSPAALPSGIVSTAQGAAAASLAGRTLAAMDFNGDGLKDILVGAPGQSSLDASALHIVYAPLPSGTSITLGGAPNLTLTGASGSLSGCGIAAATDLTGDPHAYPDILVGACLASEGNTSNGVVYLIPGRGE